MSVLIEDSPRSFQVGWIAESANAGVASGAIVDPWASPFAHRGGPGVKPGIVERAREFKDLSIPCWFDPMTHALQMPGVGDFRYYSEFDLWGGPRGDLTDGFYRTEHVRRVFNMQTALASPHIAPTLLLHAGLSNDSTLALQLARASVEQDPATVLSIAGSGSFWASVKDLDSHIGGLAVLRPAGWSLTFTRPSNGLPPDVTADEVFGLCRTVRALSEYAPVYVSHGDLAALPAVAAGAYAVGTGWDKRQRSVSYSDYVLRTEGIGKWYIRPTLIGLLGTLSGAESALLETQAPELADWLGGTPTPGAKEAYGVSI